MFWSYLPKKKTILMVPVSPSPLLASGDRIQEPLSHLTLARSPSYWAEIIMKSFPLKKKVILKVLLSTRARSHRNTWSTDLSTPPSSPGRTPSTQPPSTLFVSKLCPSMIFENNSSSQYLRKSTLILQPLRFLPNSPMRKGFWISWKTPSGTRSTTRCLCNQWEPE